MDGLRYRLVSDDDGHWYIVPADRQEEFDELIMSDEFNRAMPAWVQEVNGHPNNVSFVDPINDLR